MVEKSESGLHHVAVPTLREAVVLGSVRRRGPVFDAEGSEVVGEGEVFSAIVGEYGGDALLEFVFNE